MAIKLEEIAKLSKSELKRVAGYEKFFDKIIRETYDSNKKRVFAYLGEYPDLNERELAELKRRYAAEGWAIAIGSDQRDGSYVQVTRKNK